ncbi:hypothetical protein [Acetobacter sp. UBA5411]|uniref:hypothetical protein n=1 Tax=Acetobacter sp. UBA5411 TaxID=1945905 RepID=UPI0025C0507F|nr:hypothetical protein [Acetobacter sp. UBA5411]
MAAQKRRVVIRQAEDMGPTPERIAKGDFETGSPPRVLTTVTAMLRSGDITQDEADAADRWYRDYQLAFLTGYTLSRYGQANTYEAPHEDHDPNTQRLRHDAVSFAVVRGQAAGRISEIRSRLGMCGHQRLKMMLVDEMSFSRIGEAIYPKKSQPDAVRSAKFQCAIILEQLREFYQSSANEQKNLRDCIEYA